MAISRVQTGTAVTSTGIATVAPSWPATTAIGNLLIAIIAHNRPTTLGTITTPSGWSLIAQADGAVAQDTPTRIYAIENAGATRSGTETFTLSTGRDMYGVLLEYSGIATATALDKLTQSNNVSGTAATTGTTAATVQADELIIAAIGNPNTSTAASEAFGGSATGGSLVELAEVTSGNATAGQKVTCRVYEQIVTATGTAEVHSTLSVARVSMGVIATYKASAAAPTVIPPKPLIVTSAVEQSYEF